jgi:transposase
MVEGTVGSHHKEGSSKMSKHSIVCAGIDTGKYKLDVALNGSRQQLQIDNTTDGHAALSSWLKRHKVERVGIEASGGPRRCAPMPGFSCNGRRTTRSMRR